jgi:BirA family biotin operon repressor/biotin-[acetyl-CoA-carboxylase] ligase
VIVHEEWRLATRIIGRRVLRYASVDSTNNVALELAKDPGNEGVAILAGEQTAGRGRHGRCWSAPPDCAVLLSILLFPSPAIGRPVILTAWAAVAACNATCSITGLRARIRWPNDVLLAEGKVCGILIEKRGAAAVIGLGLNVNQSKDDLTQMNLPQATSLAVVTGQRWDVPDVARVLLHELDQAYAPLSEGDFGALERPWQQGLGFLGKEVELDTLKGPSRGRVGKLTFSGIRIDTNDSQALYLEPEAVHHIRAI